MEKKLSLFVLLCAATSLANCQQSTRSGATPKPDDGSFVRNTYRNDFFGFSYVLPGEWHKSRVAPAALPPGAYYLFIGDRDTGHSLLNRVIIVADPESKNRPGISTQEYLSAFIRAQVTNANAEVIREPSSFVSGGKRFLWNGLQKGGKWDYGLQLHGVRQTQQLLAQLEFCDAITAGPRRCGEYASTYFLSTVPRRASSW